MCACARGDAYTSLPEPGTTLRFDFPLLGGGRVTERSAGLTPTVVALWATDCSFSQKALAGLEALRQEYEPLGVNVLVIADDADPVELQAFMDSARVQLRVAYADGTITRTFDRTATFPWMSKLGLPSFLIVSGEGEVLHKAPGLPLNEVNETEVRLSHLRPALDSILSVRPL